MDRGLLCTGHCSALQPAEWQTDERRCSAGCESPESSPARAVSAAASSCASDCVVDVRGPSPGVPSSAARRRPAAELAWQNEPACQRCEANAYSLRPFAYQN